MPRTQPDNRPRCDGPHRDRPPVATLSLVMLDTASPDACSFACLTCAVLVVTDMSMATEPIGYEVRALTG